MVLIKGRGSNLNSHHNKPIKEHPRTRFNVSCSDEQNEAIKELTSHIRPRERSSYINNFIEKAMSNNYSEISEKPDNKNGMFQISCSHELKLKIDAFVDANIPKRCRSRWIIDVVFHYANA